MLARSALAALAVALLAAPLATSAVSPALAPSVPLVDLACDQLQMVGGLPGTGVASHDNVLNPCPGIRPGGGLILRAGPLEIVYCTMAFVLTDGQDLYVATAGHCVEPSLGAPGLGERVAAIGVPGTFGTVVYQWCEDEALNGGCGAGKDFGLIKVDANKRGYVTNAMCHWGAPTGGMFTAFDDPVDYDPAAALEDPTPEAPPAEWIAPTPKMSIQHYGWGMVLGNPSGGLHSTPNPATQAREGLLLQYSNETYVLVETAAISGDSGSGVLVMDLPGLHRLPMMPAAAPKALGVLTHISVGGVGFVQRLDVSLAKVQADKGWTLTLYTA
ncbi:MAG TPA: hypothetical protein VNZ52_09100 [Candidatus Thermoplasmatota archaeon]|nr:hypothetical protein [Candidatus Thermoplasmatota archaeon]